MISIGPSSLRTFAIASSTAARSVTSTGSGERVGARLARRSSAARGRGVAVEVEQRDPVPLAARRWADGEAHARCGAR